MKRILVLIAFIASSAAAQTVSVGTTSASCGAIATLPVSIDNVSGLLALEFRIAYDSRLTAGAVTVGTLTNGFSISSNVVNGVLRVAMASGTPVSGSGTVANISFTAGSSASGSVPLTISNVLVNDVARTGVSGAITVTCVTTPPAPTLTAPANGATGVAAPVTLQWSSVASATLYRVFFGTTPAPSMYDVTSATSIMVSTLPGTTYYWSVSAANAAGETPSTTFSFTTAGVACTTPGTVQLSGPSQVSSGASFDLSWTAAASGTQYLVEEASNQNFIGATTTIATGNTISLTRTATAATTLYFRVHARNTTGSCNVDGPVSNTVAVQITPRPTLPAGMKIFPVVGTTEGIGGSLFRTTVQLHNPTGSRVSGRIVFHAQSSSGMNSDPSIAYTLAASETISYLDLLTALGVATTIGSADLIPDNGSPAPVSVVRVFNDAGTAGTTGMTIDQADPRDAIQAGHRGVLIAPPDPNRARMNIGIRTLLDGASVLVTVRDKHGATINSSRWTYQPTSFAQVSVMQFANAVLLGDESITIDVESGSAIVYGAITDNATHDPSIQIAKAVN